jgi:hypothetical protein
MDMDLNPFARVLDRQADDGECWEGSTGSSCRRGCASDVKPVVHRFPFVSLAFDRPQTAFGLPQWRWPLIEPYNGFSGGERIRGWQLLRFYELNGWLRYPAVCWVAGQCVGVVLHNEDYFRPWEALPVSRRAHLLIHTRMRYRRAWQSFLETEALPDALGALARIAGCPRADNGAAVGSHAAQCRSSSELGQGRRRPIRSTLILTNRGWCACGQTQATPLAARLQPQRAVGGMSSP